MLYPCATLSFLSLLLVSAAARQLSFKDYVQKFRKNYTPGSAEWFEHEAVYLSQVKEIAEHNRLYDLKQATFFREVNQFTDLTASERLSSFGYAGAEHATAAKPTRVHTPGTIKDVPPAMNWNEAGMTTPVKNQGHCGSCWAFSTAAMVESYLARDEGILTELSVEQLVDCVENPNECGGQGGCHGATVNLALEYLMDVGYLSQWSYPYTQYWNSKTNAEYDCQYDKLIGYETSIITAYVEGYVKVQNNSYDAMIEAIAQGPVAISVDASTWHSYGGGIYDGCDKDSITLNHAVQLVGYGTDEDTGLDYWLVRNSWGPYWGEEGHMRLRRYNPQKGETTPCGYDYSPSSGSECKGGADILYVCGNCGMLWDASYPTAVRRA